jgi:hypothetical protein
MQKETLTASVQQDQCELQVVPEQETPQSASSHHCQYGYMHKKQ